MRCLRTGSIRVPHGRRMERGFRIRSGRGSFSPQAEGSSFDQTTGNIAGPAIDIYVAKNDPGGAWAVNSAAWAPDGRTLAVVLQETHWDKIWLIASTGGKPKELTFGAGEDEEPIFSLDGKWIAFESNRDLAEERHIWVVPAAGGEPHRVTIYRDLRLGPHWTPDSQSVRFCGGRRWARQRRMWPA